MGINFNPFLRHNDSLSPEEIQAKVDERNQKTREMVKRAYQTGDVPESAADRAAGHSSISRKTAEAQKANRDAAHWSEAQNNSRHSTKGWFRMDTCDES